MTKQARNPNDEAASVPLQAAKPRCGCRPQVIRAGDIWNSSGIRLNSTQPLLRITQHALLQRGSKSATSAFSSFNSVSVAAIFARLKSFSGTPWTISQVTPLVRMG